MAKMDEVAVFFSGNYLGWARQPEWEDWEDLIGLVRLKCTANRKGCLNVTITTLEFGKWTGSLRLQDGVIEGTTGQGKAYFKFVIQERRQAEGIQVCFNGGIYNPPAKLLLELRFTGDLRKRRPEPG